MTNLERVLSLRLCGWVPGFVWKLTLSTVGSGTRHTNVALGQNTAPTLYGLQYTLHYTLYALQYTISSTQNTVDRPNAGGMQTRRQEREQILSSATAGICPYGPRHGRRGATPLLHRRVAAFLAATKWISFHLSAGFLGASQSTTSRGKLLQWGNFLRGVDSNRLERPLYELATASRLPATEVFPLCGAHLPYAQCSVGVQCGAE